jgi:predicted nucleic acid-binding Zn ribbon protein
MRGRGKPISTVLADALGARGGASASLSSAFAEAAGPRLAKELSARGKLRDGRLLVVASSAAWAQQAHALESELLAKLRARLGDRCPTALSIHVGRVER